MRVSKGTGDTRSKEEGERTAEESTRKETNLIVESQSSVLLSKVADLSDGSDASTHGVDGLESDDLGGVERVLGELRLEIGEIVVLPNFLLGSRMSDSLDHGRMVGGVGKVDKSGDPPSESGESRIVGDVAGGEDESRFLPVQVGELVLESEMEGVVSGDVTSSSSSASVLAESLSVEKEKTEEESATRSLYASREKKRAHFIVAKTTGLLLIPR